MTPYDSKVRAFLLSPSGIPLSPGSSHLRDLFCLIYKSLFYSFVILEVYSETQESPTTTVNPVFFSDSEWPVSPYCTYPCKHVTPIHQSYYICSQHLYGGDLALSSPLLYLFACLPVQKLSQAIDGLRPNASPYLAANLEKKNNCHVGCSTQSRLLAWFLIVTPTACSGKSWSWYFPSVLSLSDAIKKATCATRGFVQPAPKEGRAQELPSRL